MRARVLYRWLAVVVVGYVVAAVVLVSLVPEPQTSLRAYLDSAVLDQPYENSVALNMSGIGTSIGVDRDPASPYYGTIYAVSNGAYAMDVRRSTDGGATFNLASLINTCSTSGLACSHVFPDVAVGKAGVVYVLLANTVFRSADQGTTWQTVAYFGEFGTSATQPTEPPSSMATDNRTGAVYVVHVNASGTVVLSRSLDEGTTWSRAAVVSGGATSATPHVAAINDNVTVAFLASGGSSCERASCAYVAAGVSHDGGATWPSVLAVSPPGLLNSSAPSVTVSHDGIIAVSWDLPVSSGASATFVSPSRDYGESFSTPIEVSQYPGDPSMGFGDALAFDGQSRLFVTWQSLEVSANGTYTTGSVYVASTANLASNFTSASFSVSVEGAGTNGSTYERLAAGLDGHVYLTWYDLHSGGALFRSVSGEATGDVIPTMRPVPTKVAELELVDPTTATVQAHALWTGSPVRFAELPPNSYEVRIRIANASAVAGVLTIRTWNRTAFSVQVDTVTTAAGTPRSYWTTVAIGGGLTVFAASALVALQHTRLVREQLLQRRVRLLIYDAIRGEPGSSFTEVRDTVGLQNGVAAYHLRVLEKQGLIHTEKGRRHRWYYPNGDVSLWRDLPLSPLQKSLVDQVRDAPGIGIRELARNVNRHHASVAYNVKGLVRDGLLRTERTGRKVLCYPPEEETPALFDVRPEG